MRQLHPVALHEAFFASGIYSYYENGNLSGVLEHWTIHQLPDGSHLIRVDRDARQPFGATLLLEALRSADGRIERFDVQYFHAGANPIKHARASFTCFEGVVEIGRTIDGGERIDERVPLPKGCGIYPLMRVFTGSLIQQAAFEQGVPVPIFLPDIAHTTPDRFLSGVIDYRTARLLGSRTIEIAKKPIQTQEYQFVGGQYTSDSRFWLDERGLLIGYEIQQNEDTTWRVLLTQVAQRRV